jgi:hypothetical protein
MLYISALGMAFGATQKGKLHLSLFVLLSLTVAAGVGIINAASGHSLLYSIREAFYSAWSAEAGAFAGLVFERLVLPRD